MTVVPKVLAFLALLSVSAIAMPHGEVHHGEVHHGEVHHGEVHHDEVHHGEVHHGEVHHDEVHKDSVIKGSCESLSPAGDARQDHGTTIQLFDHSSYTITLSAERVKAGERVTVTISGDENNSFKGFMVQARDQQDHKVGTFVATDDKSQTLKCNSDDDTIAQKSVHSDKETVSFDWIAPPAADVHENVVFYVTIVKSRFVFWVKLPSAPLTVE